MLSTWFPQAERARANGVYSVGQYVGLGFMIPLLTYIVATFGWRALFFIFGGIGIVYGIRLVLRYTASRTRAAASTRRSSTTSPPAAASPSQAGGFVLSWAAVRTLLRQRQILGASIGQFCGNSTLVFFLTWFPSYLATERGMDWIRSGFARVAAVHRGFRRRAASAAYVSDGIIRRTGSATLGRKLPIVAGLLLASTMVLANFTPSNALVIAIMSRGVLRPGHGQSRLDADRRRGAEAAHGPDRRQCSTSARISPASSRRS